MIVIREPVLGRSLPANLQDEFAVAVIRDSQIVGHILSDIIFTGHVVFYQTKGLVVCHMTGRRRKGNGLEVPSNYINYYGCIKDQKFI